LEVNRKRFSKLAIYAILLGSVVNFQTQRAEAVIATPATVCSAGTCTVTFSSPSDFYSYTVPSGLTYLNVTVRGGAGGGSNAGGGIVTGRLNISAGSVLTIYVGGAGAQGSLAAPGLSGGRSSGGNTTNSRSDNRSGGGHSEITLGSTSLIIAGGAGGQGGWAGGNGGGGGGSSWVNGISSGQNGLAGQAQPGTGGGSNVGTGGAANASGTAGSSGIGQVGGTGGNGGAGGGGGGGGGYRGGGGGGGDSDGCCADAGGGGGGSSFYNLSYFSTAPTTQAGGNSGVGSIVLSYPSTAVSTFTSSQSSPSNTNSAISYSLTMSESVTGMENADFENAGTSTGCTFSVSGSGSSYSLSISSCSEGTLIPRLKANSVTGSAVGPTSATAATTTIVIDRTVPTISSVTAPNNATYKPTDTPTFTVAFSESVTVTGTPRLSLTVGALTKYANFVSQTDSRTALFRYTVASSTTEFDTDGISISNTLDLNGGAIADLATNAISTLTFSAPNTASIFVAQPPAVPTIDSATAGSGFISIYFTAGVTYGSAITNYQYSTNNGTNWTARSPVDTSTPLTISGLTNGNPYQVRIRAVSAVGTSDSSTSITATPNAVTVAAGSNISTTYGRSASSSTFTSTGGVSPYVYTLSSTVPGISISNGVVTASSTLNAGTYSLNVVSTDAYLANGTKAITITVTKATQETLTITSSNAIFSGTPSSLSLLTSGGSDTGTVTYSVVAGGSAIGCSISGSQLWVNTSGTCKIVATKATTTNYLIAYSDTATISFAVFVSRQPVQTQSAPTQLPINGQNSLDLSQTNTVPAVTGVFLVGSTYEINGTGFTGVNRVVIGGSEATISSSTATKIVINSAGLMPGPLFIECSDGRIGPSPFYFFTP
jgi:hypothetical protein